MYALVIWQQMQATNICKITALVCHVVGIEQHLCNHPLQMWRQAKIALSSNYNCFGGM